MRKDSFISPDYFALDKLLSEENLLIRDVTREWVKSNVSPVIESAVQNDKFPICLLYTSTSPPDGLLYRMPSYA